MVQSLAISIRSFAGAYADAPIVVNFVDAVDRSFVADLEGLAVEIRTVPRVPGQNPLANKLRMLEVVGQIDFDVLVALDCDVVVTGDLSPWVDPHVIGVKPADYDRFTDDEWQALFAALDVPSPARVMRATATGQPIYPYFNSGSLLVPSHLCTPLGAAWKNMFAEVSALLSERPDLIREQWQWLAEQASLAFAILRNDLPWRALPAELNFPSHVPIPAGTLRGEPVIIHYHCERDDRGFLLKSSTPALDPWLDRVNRRRAEVTGVPYAGLRGRPWSQRLWRSATERSWELLSDSRWYKSPAGRCARHAIKRLARPGPAG